MTKYRVKPGYTFGAFGTYREGDIVELPSADAQGFLDKLELVPAELPSAPPEAMPADPPSAIETVEPVQADPPATAAAGPADEGTPPDAPAEKPAGKRAPVKPAGKPANG